MIRRLLVWSSLVVFPLSAAAGQQPAPTAESLAAGAAMALEERRFGDALAGFTAAQALRPDEPSLSYGAGVAAYMMGREPDAEAFLGRALTLQPALTHAALLLGELQYRRGRVKDAIGTYQAALIHLPGDATLNRRLDQWLRDDRLEARFNESRGARFRVLFEGPADQALARRVVEMLERQTERIGQLLRSYPDSAIDVVLYTQRQFQGVTQAPSWAGGAYDGRIRIPALGAGSDVTSLERVVAHEYVHALVARLGGPDVPAWLNEGLAVVLEPHADPREMQGVLGDGAPLRLEELHDGFAGMDSTRARRAYATSAIAVRRMLDVHGPGAVVLLLKDLATGTPFERAFRQRLFMPYSEFQRQIH